MAFLLDIVTPHAPPRRRSSLMLLVLLLLLDTTSPTPLQQPSSSMLFLLLLFLDTTFPTLPQCNTFSSLTQLLLHATPPLHILGTSLLPLDVVVVHSQDVAPTLPISNWYFPPAFMFLQVWEDQAFQIQLL